MKTYVWQDQSDSRGALCNQGNEEVHVIDEGVVIRPGQVLGLVFVGGLLVIVNIDEPLVHPGHIAKVLRQRFETEGVLILLGWGCKHWHRNTGIRCTFSACTHINIGYT